MAKHNVIFSAESDDGVCMTLAELRDLLDDWSMNKGADSKARVHVRTGFKVTKAGSPLRQVTLVDPT